MCPYFIQEVAGKFRFLLQRWLALLGCLKAVALSKLALTTLSFTVAMPTYVYILGNAT
jgi:hypothetical protein